MLKSSLENKIIAIDIDGVIVNTCDMWKEYLLGSYKLKNPDYCISKDPLPYKLTELFEIPEYHDPCDWWYKKDLYDNLSPSEDSLKWISKLKEDGCEIVFVSLVIGDHHASKERFINKWFPYNDAVILTKTKKYTLCDYFVDDCYKNLNPMKDNVSCIKFRMDYQEEVLPVKNFPIVNNWEECYELIKRGELL